MAVRKQVPHRKILPPNAIFTLGPTGLSTQLHIFRCFNVVTIGDKFTTKPRSWQVSFIITGAASISWVLGCPVQAFIFNMRSPRPRMGRPVCIFLGPSCIDRPMDLLSDVLFFLKHRQPNLCIFLKKTQRSVLFFYIRIGMPGPTYVSLLTILYIFKLFYMLLYIIVIVIVYLILTYVRKQYPTSY